MKQLHYETPKRNCQCTQIEGISGTILVEFETVDLKLISKKGINDGYIL